MQVFVHHIYEYEKGLRNLVLHTTSKNNLEMIEMKLGNRKISYKIYETKNWKRLFARLYSGRRFYVRDNVRL